MIKSKNDGGKAKPTTIAITPYNREWLKGLGRKGESYDDVIAAIREIFKQKSIRLNF